MQSTNIPQFAVLEIGIRMARLPSILILFLVFVFFNVTFGGEASLWKALTRTNHEAGQDGRTQRGRACFLSAHVACTAMYTGCSITTMLWTFHCELFNGWHIVMKTESY